MNKYDVFNQPYHIGGVEIKNRFAVVPMTTGLSPMTSRAASATTSSTTSSCAQRAASG